MRKCVSLKTSQLESYDSLKAVLTNLRFFHSASSMPRYRFDDGSTVFWRHSYKNGYGTLGILLSFRYRILPGGARSRLAGARPYQCDSSVIRRELNIGPWHLSSGLDLQSFGNLYLLLKRISHNKIMSIALFTFPLNCRSLSYFRPSFGAPFPYRRS